RRGEDRKPPAGARPAPRRRGPGRPDARRRGRAGHDRRVLRLSVPLLRPRRAHHEAHPRRLQGQGAHRPQGLPAPRSRQRAQGRRGRPLRLRPGQVLGDARQDVRPAARARGRAPQGLCARDRRRRRCEVRRLPRRRGQGQGRGGVGARRHRRGRPLHPLFLHQRPAAVGRAAVRVVPGTHRRRAQERQMDGRTPMRNTSLALLVAAALGCARAPNAPAPAAPPSAPAAAAATAVAATPAPAQPAAEAPRPPVKVSTVEGASEDVLQNGMRVVLLPDPSQSIIITDIVYLVGSRHEGYGETGMAHLLEHMLFKGSPKFPDFDAMVRQKLGDVSNASTWFDRTNYFFRFPAEEERLAFALDVESDRMLNANIAAQDLAKEFSVVRNEFETDENDPSGILTERMLSTAFLWHNYGKSTIGSRADIERVPADRLKRFYKKYYRPENAVLIIGGKFDADKTLALVNDKFARL